MEKGLTMKSVATAVLVMLYKRLVEGTNCKKMSRTRYTSAESTLQPEINSSTAALSTDTELFMTVEQHVSAKYNRKNHIYLTRQEDL
jgi:hypothetical protein